MSPDQRHFTGFLMIEINLLPPRCRMTRAAILTQAALMMVVALMALHALSGSFTVRRLLVVTLCATERTMLSREAKRRQMVIERFRHQPGDIRARAAVFPMAVSAGTRWNSRMHAMELSLLSNITGNFLVAVEAQRTLSIAIESDVACATIFLQVGMRGTQLARTDKRFNAGSLHLPQADRQQGQHHDSN